MSDSLYSRSIVCEQRLVKGLDARISTVEVSVVTPDGRVSLVVVVRERDALGRRQEPSDVVEGGRSANRPSLCDNVAVQDDSVCRKEAAERNAEGVGLR